MTSSSIIKVLPMLCLLVCHFKCSSSLKHNGYCESDSNETVSLYHYRYSCGVNSGTLLYSERFLKLSLLLSQPLSSSAWMGLYSRQLVSIINQAQNFLHRSVDTQLSTDARSTSCVGG